MREPSQYIADRGIWGCKTYANTAQAEGPHAKSRLVSGYAFRYTVSCRATNRAFRRCITKSEFSRHLWIRTFSMLGCQSHPKLLFGL
jgi:hypothetical protein